MKEQIKVLTEKVDKLQATIDLLVNTIFQERLNKIMEMPKESQALLTHASFIGGGTSNIIEPDNTHGMLIVV